MILNRVVVVAAAAAALFYSAKMYLFLIFLIPNLHIKDKQINICGKQNV